MFAWYILSIFSLFAYGFQNFLFKVSAQKKCNSAWTTFSFMFTVSILGTIMFFVTDEKILDLKFLLFISFVNGIAFLFSTIGKMEALKYIDASIAYPIQKLYIILVVAFSVAYFKDALTVNQIIGIILSVLVILTLTGEKKKDSHEVKNFKIGLLFVLLSLFFSAISVISVKFAAINTGQFSFIAISYALNILFSLLFTRKLQTEKENKNQKQALVIGFLIGLLNFIGFVALLKAFAVGPLSIVSTINSMSFLIVVVLSILVYKERITTKRFIGILLAIVAVVLMKN